MKKWLLVVAATLLLTGCPQRAPQPPAKISEIKPPPEQKAPLPREQRPPETELVPLPPKTVTFDWQGSATPLIEEMIAKSQATKGSLLLLDTIRNRSNGSLPTEQATKALHQILSAYSTFNLVPEQQVQQARNALNISTDDSLANLGKTLGLARYTQANYVLTTTLDGDVKAPTLMLQLLLVQSGELIWTGSGVVHINQ